MRRELQNAASASLFMPLVQSAIAAPDGSLTNRDRDEQFHAPPSDADAISTHFVIRNFRHMDRKSLHRLAHTHFLNSPIRQAIGATILTLVKVGKALIFRAFSNILSNT